MEVKNEVMDKRVRYLVHLGMLNCVCRVWEISGIPCKHVATVVAFNRLNLKDYVHPYFSKDNYLRAYGGMIHFILDHTMWDDPILPEKILQPPPLKRLPERPRKNRRRETNEGASGAKRSQTLKCNWCKEFGHNKKTCERGPIKGKSNGSGSRTADDLGRDNGSGFETSDGRGNGDGYGVGVDLGSGRVKGRPSTRKKYVSSSRGKGSTSTRGRESTEHVHDGVYQLPSQCVTQIDEFLQMA